MEDRQFREMFNLIDQGFCVCEVLVDDQGKAVDYRFLEVNAVFEQQTGLPEPIGKTARELVPNLESYWVEIYGKVAIEREPVHVIQAAAALGRWFEVYAFPFDDPKLRRFGALFKDVTQTKSTQEALRESEARYRLLADAMPHLVWTANNDGIVDYYNRRVSEYGGAAEPDGTWLWSLIVHPDDVDHTWAAWNTAVKQGSTYECEHRLKMADGSFRWHISRARPAIVGDSIRWYGTATDTHETKQAQDALLLSEQRFRAALDASRVVVFNQDRDLRYTWIYNSSISVTLDMVKGKTDADVFRIPEEAALITTLKRQVLETGMPSRNEVWVHNGDQRICYEMFIAPLRGSAGEIEGVTCAAIDITERKLAEQEYQRALAAEQEAHQTLLKFMGVVTHEMRSPLTVIRGFASTLMAEDVQWDADRQREFIEIIDEEAKRLEERIRDLLDITRSQTGTLHVEPVSTSLDHILGEARPQLHALTARHDFRLDIPTDLPSVHADSQRIGQVIVNLIDNAAKFSPAGSCISITAQPIPDFVQISVQDEGPGIPADQREIVFQPFRQAEHGLARKQGLGLGLAIIKSIIEAHGGICRIDGDAGAMISFTLPVTSPD